MEQETITIPIPNNLKNYKFTMVSSDTRSKRGSLKSAQDSNVQKARMAFSPRVAMTPRQLPNQDRQIKVFSPRKSRDEEKEKDSGPSLRKKLGKNLKSSSPASKNIKKAAINLVRQNLIEESQQQQQQPAVQKINIWGCSGESIEKKKNDPQAKFTLNNEFLFVIKNINKDRVNRYINDIKQQDKYLDSDVYNKLNEDQYLQYIVQLQNYIWCNNQSDQFFSLLPGIGQKIYFSSEQITYKEVAHSYLLLLQDLGEQIFKERQDYKTEIEELKNQLAKQDIDKQEEECLFWKKQYETLKSEQKQILNEIEKKNQLIREFSLMAQRLNKEKIDNIENSNIQEENECPQCEKKQNHLRITIQTNEELRQQIKKSDEYIDKIQQEMDEVRKQLENQQMIGKELIERQRGQIGKRFVDTRFLVNILSVSKQSYDLLAEAVNIKLANIDEQIQQLNIIESIKYMLGKLEKVISIAQINKKNPPPENGENVNNKYLARNVGLEASQLDEVMQGESQENRKSIQSPRNQNFDYLDQSENQKSIATVSPGKPQFLIRQKLQSPAKFLAKVKEGENK